MSDRPCDAIILAHNEAANIEAVIRNVLDQSWPSPRSLGRVVVVSTASIDGTDEIVREVARSSPRVQLLSLPVRRGKVHDVNAGIAQTTADLIAIMDADIVLSPDCLPRLLASFDSPNVGMAIPARAVANPRRGLLNRIGHLMTEMQNLFLDGKAGQVLVVDRRFAEVDDRVTVDDAFQEWTVRSAGFSIARPSFAVVTSVSPRTASELVRQRRRVHAQYLRLEHVTGHRPVTRSPRDLIRAVWRAPTLRREGRVDVVGFAVAFDVLARILGRLDARAGRDYATWTASPSTKNHG
jgi:glycosyltransferase involved in cell wall biosynthesis